MQTGHYSVSQSLHCLANLPNYNPAVNNFIRNQFFKLIGTLNDKLRQIVEQTSSQKVEHLVSALCWNYPCDEIEQIMSTEVLATLSSIESPEMRPFCKKAFNYLVCEILSSYAEGTSGGRVVCSAESATRHLQMICELIFNGIDQYLGQNGLSQ